MRLHIPSKLLTWGSDDVVRKFIDHEASSDSIPEDPTAIESLPPETIQLHLQALEDLFFAFRADVGHKNRKLRRGDLRRMLARVDEDTTEEADRAQGS